jgi:hypothetical protein
MQLTTLRYSSSTQDTLGFMYVDQDFSCYTLEDRYRAKKVAGETRIAGGIYPVTLRKAGRLHRIYSDRWDWHKHGMLWIRNVPDFKYIYIHPGNEHEHTEGCILVGDVPNNNQVEKGLLSGSSRAYSRLYQAIAPRIAAGEAAEIVIGDLVELLKFAA